MKFRNDAQRVEVYNEGLAVYLHDPAHAAAIVAARPKTLFDFHDDTPPSKDKALKKLVEEGKIVTYFLRQDDSIVVDVSVGPPLAKEEIKKRGVPLMKPSHTVISLPSGRLRVDSANTFRLSDEARECANQYEEKHGKPPADDNLAAFGLEDESGEVRVPPGDYVLTLYRVDFEKMEDNDDDDEGFDGPGELIVLTPAGNIERPKKIPPVIEYGAGYARVAGLRAWKIVDGVFHGRMVGGCAANFNWRHAAKLGLRRGQRLTLTHEGKRHDAVYLAGVDPRGGDAALFSILYPDELKAFHARQSETLTAAIHDHSIVKIPLLWVQTLKEGEWLTAEKNSPLSIEAHADFLLPASPGGAVPQGKLEGEVLRGEVLAAGPKGIELGVGAKQLKPLKSGKIAALTLTIGGASAPVFLLPDADHRHRPYHIVGSVERADEELFKDVFGYMIEGGDEVFRALVGAGRSKRIIAVLQEYKKGCKFDQYKGYVPKDAARGAEMKAEVVGLWREGLHGWNVKGAMSAVLARHWDDPNATTLACRPIAHPGENIFAAAAGKTFELRRTDRD